MRYECHYRAFRSMAEGGQTIGLVWADCIQDLKSGFWINKEGELTLGSDAFIWIPPGQIIHIIKRSEG